MSRYKSSEGGWFKMWGKLWLLDEKLKKIGDTGELAFVRMLCLANSYLKNGYFCSNLGSRVDPKYLCGEARISREVFDLLEKEGFIKADAEDRPYYIPNWHKYQSRSYTKSSVETPKKQKESAPDEPKGPTLPDELTMAV